MHSVIFYLVENMLWDELFEIRNDTRAFFPIMTARNKK